MSDNVHYFQRYRQKENLATNNTLLLLKRIYVYKPIIFYKFLYDLIFADDKNMAVSSADELMLNFKNQVSGKGSNPDASIKQTSFELIIETKNSGSNFSSDQLIKHLNVLDNSNATLKVLLALSNSDNIDKKIENDVIKAIGTKKVIFKIISFQTLISKLEEHINDYEFEMLEIIEDFFDFCREEKLIKNTQLIARTASGTFDDDKKYGYYHDGYGRNYGVRFFGLYKNKAIKCVGKVEKIVAIDKGKFERVVESYDGSKELTEDQEKRLNEIINLNKPERCYIYLVDKFYDTNFFKRTAYAIQSKKYFDVDRILDKLCKNKNVNELTAEELAKIINNVAWEDISD